MGKERTGFYLRIEKEEKILTGVRLVGLTLTDLLEAVAFLG